MAKRNVAGLARFGCQRNTDQLRLHGIERIGFGIDGDKALFMGGGNPAIEGFKGRDGFIIRMVKGNGEEGGLSFSVIPADAGTHLLAD